MTDHECEFQWKSIHRKYICIGCPKTLNVYEAMPMLNEHAALKRVRIIALGMWALLLNSGYSEKDIVSRFGKADALADTQEV